MSEVKQFYWIELALVGIDYSNVLWERDELLFFFESTINGQVKS
jgi:hypothetical protein